MHTVTDFSLNYDLDEVYLNDDMSNKLFCTFSTEETLDDVLTSIKEKYFISPTLLSYKV